ncbi:hypothetical protein BDF22DRAFT_747220 [Syncephalis plumigaleata]|nr:hypothetical protein BDF22DRAFT_747220 [Syncephalis plumigaleata]
MGSQQSTLQPEPEPQVQPSARPVRLRRRTRAPLPQDQYASRKSYADVDVIDPISRLSIGIYERKGKSLSLVRVNEDSGSYRSSNDGVYSSTPQGNLSRKTSYGDNTLRASSKPRKIIRKASRPDVAIRSIRMQGQSSGLSARSSQESVAYNYSKSVPNNYQGKMSIPASRASSDCTSVMDGTLSRNSSFRGHSRNNSIGSGYSTDISQKRRRRGLRRSLSFRLSSTRQYDDFSGSFPLDASAANNWEGEKSGATLLTVAATAGSYNWRRSMDADAYSRRQYTPTKHNAISTTSLNVQGNDQSRSKSLDLALDNRDEMERGRTPMRIRRKRSKSKSLQRPLHQYIMGRRYHNVQGVPYCLPNDPEESDRLDQQHYILRALFGKNHLAPINRPAYALDIGCGTGTWQMEMAAEFPSTEFIGIDISPIQPTTCLPVNCHFEIANMLENLPFADERFDYVHQRLTSFGLPEEKLDILLSEHARVCSPGGWLELLETDWEPRDVLRRLCERRGCNPSAIFELVPSIETAGFDDVRRLMVQLPLGSWGGMIGTQARKIIFNAWEALRGPMLENEVATDEEISRALLMLDTELDEHPMWLCLIVYLGQREQL